MRWRCRGHRRGGDLRRHPIDPSPPDPGQGTRRSRSAPLPREPASQLGRGDDLWCIDRCSGPKTDRVSRAATSPATAELTALTVMVTEVTRAPGRPRQRHRARPDRQLQLGERTLDGQVDRDGELHVGTLAGHRQSSGSPMRPRRSEPRRPAARGRCHQLRYGRSRRRIMSTVRSMGRWRPVAEDRKHACEDRPRGGRRKHRLR